MNAGPALGSGRPALRAAAEKGHLEVIERLLKAKANVDAGAAEYDGVLALEAAVQNGYSQVTKRLLTAEVSKEGILRALSSAKMYRDERLVELLKSSINTSYDSRYLSLAGE